MMNPNETVDREFSWDDEIANEGTPFRVLPQGDYAFTIVSFVQARHQPREGGKLPACNKAVLTVRVQDPTDGAEVDLPYNLFLHSSQEWKLCEFFMGIGQKKKGEPLRMRWNEVVGSTGQCHVSVRKFTGRDGEERERNEITRWYEKPQAVAPAFQAGAF